ncbi:unnamed protein product [Orchesella dallaii]|uniref:glutathione transferase n=1 Tax=Orchesella dallaii TaxID=48710 RepID=A0ABP1RVY8_9HEXA
MAYKLTYFDLAARGEPARLIFAAANVKFVDNRIKMPDWPALKPTLEWGQVPILQFGDKTLTQSKAIYRYLARKFKLSGTDEWESSQCDELVDATSDLVDEFVKFVFKEPDPVKQAEGKKNFITTTLPTFLGRINKRQMDNDGPWLVGKSMTWADIVVAEMLRQMSAATDPTALNGYPHVRKMIDAVFAHPNIKQYVDASRPS